MRVLSLFTGGGLGDYGLELAGMETVGQCEKEDYCQKLLKLRWPDVPKWEDIHDVTGEDVRQKCGTVDVVSGGFPCQPFSVAGQQRGTEDDRHLWPEMLRVIREVQPTWVIAENVPGLIRLALDDVLASLETEGYETITLVFPAHALGAPHKRERVWIVAYARGRGFSGQERSNEQQRRTEAIFPGETIPNRPTEVRETVAHTTSQRRGTEHKDIPEQTERSSNQLPELGGTSKDVSNTRQQPARSVQRPREAQGTPLHAARFSRQWETEPRVGRVVDGTSNRLDRLKLLGNGQVVQAARFIGEGIMNKERHGEKQVSE